MRLSGFAVDAETVYLLFLVSFFAGLRLGEARALRPKQFLFDKSALVIDGFLREDGTRTDFNKKGSESNRKFRIVMLPEKVLSEVQNYIVAHQKSTEDLLFTHENKPLRKEYLDSLFKRALKKKRNWHGKPKAHPPFPAVHLCHQNAPNPPYRHRAQARGTCRRQDDRLLYSRIYRG